MREETNETVEITLSAETMRMLRACAAWRNVSVHELIQAYVEDWIDVDYPESRGRLTRRCIYREGPIGLNPELRK